MASLPIDTWTMRIELPATSGPGRDGRAFLAGLLPSMLHELSQPVTALALEGVTMARALNGPDLEHPLLADTHARTMAEIERTRHLMTLISLALSDEDQITPQIDLSDLVAGATALLRRDADHRGYILRCDSGSLIGAARATPSAVLRMLIHVIDAILGADRAEPGAVLALSSTSSGSTASVCFASSRELDRSIVRNLGARGIMNAALRREGVQLSMEEYAVTLTLPRANDGPEDL